jgi:flagella basal body P-ring formation protein FlgA
MKFSSSVGKMLFSAGVMIIVMTAPAMASEMTSGAQLKNYVYKELLSRGLDSNPIISTSRQFRSCAAPLQIKPMFGGYKTVHLICSDIGGFKIAVRTQIGQMANKQRELPIFQSDTTLLAEFVVLTKSVQRGEIIDIDDVMLVKRDTNPGTGYFHDIDDVVGRKAKRAININQVIRSRHLELNYAIRKGQSVMIESTIGLVTVVSAGISAADAQLGERVKVKNKSSGLVVEGIAISKRKIRIRAK